MKTAGLALQQTPALSVPLRYFLTAPLFGVAAALVLAAYGPAAFASRWTAPVLAATHFVTLGVLTMIMLGAIQQMLPVLAGSALPRPRAVSMVVHVLLTLGVLLLGAGLLGAGATWMRASVVLLGCALALFVAAAVWALLHSHSRHASVRGIGVAVGALALTAAAGLWLGAGYGWRVALPSSLTDVHAGLGLAGWIGLLVIGVAYQVVPMFQITPDYPRPVMRWLIGALFVLLLGWGVALLFGQRTVSVPAGVLIALGLALFAGLTLRLQARRRRRVPDVSLGFWRIAMLSLLVAAGLWLLGLAMPEVTRGNTYPLLLGILMMVGFAVSATNGMLYKIVPFLVWLHLQLRQDGAPQRPAPNMKEVIPQRRARLQLYVHALAVGLLCAATVNRALFTYPAALAFAASNLLLWWNLLGAALLYRSRCREQS